MRILRAGEHKVMPWKNGLGSTTEIAIYPKGASLDDFDWRVSMASVANDGPFSSFAGIDRTLSILDGEGMVLAVAGREPVTLKRASDPYAFPADAETSATLLKGPITDLNVMSRRGKVGHRVRRFAVEGELLVDVAATAALLLCQTGNIEVDTAEGCARLGAHDALGSKTPPQQWAVAAQVRSIAFMIEFVDA